MPEVQKCKGNEFELTGRINFVDFKYSQNGVAYGRVIMSKKGKEEKQYDSFFLTVFGQTAETFAEEIKKGDTVNIIGRIGYNKYEKDGKTKEDMQLIISDFRKAKYSEEAKSYVAYGLDTDGDDKAPWESN